MKINRLDAVFDKNNKKRGFSKDLQGNLLLPKEGEDLEEYVINNMKTIRKFILSLIQNHGIIDGGFDISKDSFHNIFAGTINEEVFSQIFNIALNKLFMACNKQLVMLNSDIKVSIIVGFMQNFYYVYIPGTSHPTIYLTNQFHFDLISQKFKLEYLFDSKQLGDKINGIIDNLISLGHDYADITYYVYDYLADAGLGKKVDPSQPIMGLRDFVAYFINNSKKGINHVYKQLLESVIEGLTFYDAKKDFSISIGYNGMLDTSNSQSSSQKFKIENVSDSEFEALFENNIGVYEDFFINFIETNGFVDLNHLKLEDFQDCTGITDKQSIKNIVFHIADYFIDQYEYQPVNLFGYEYVQQFEIKGKTYFRVFIDSQDGYDLIMTNLEFLNFVLQNDIQLEYEINNVIKLINNRINYLKSKNFDDKNVMSSILIYTEKYVKQTAVYEDYADIDLVDLLRSINSFKDRSLGNGFNIMFQGILFGLNNLGEYSDLN